MSTTKKTFKNMAHVLKENGVTSKDLIAITGGTRSYSHLILKGKNNFPIKYHLEMAEKLQIDSIEFQSAFINDCMDNYRRAL